jgi:beta-mannosidase
MRLLDFSGNVLLDQVKDAQVPAQSNAIYFSVDKAALAAKGDLRKSFLVFDLDVAGKRVSRNPIFFDAMHSLDLPVAPRIDATLSKAGEEYTVTLKSAKLARNVYVSFGDLEVQSSDNYFDLLPGEPVTIRLKTAATREQLKAALATMSLTEAFNSN